jgi:hypothetical protein
MEELDITELEVRSYLRNCSFRVKKFYSIKTHNVEMKKQHEEMPSTFNTGHLFLLSQYGLKSMVVALRFAQLTRFALPTR